MRYDIVNTRIAFPAMIFGVAPLFKDWLKDIRRVRDVSQEDLAKATGISQTTISQWENGRNLPSPRNLRSVANFFGVEFGEVAPMIGLPGKGTIEIGESGEIDMARYQEILAGLEYISDEGLSLLEDQIRYVLRARYPRRARPNRGGDAGESDGGED